MITLLDKSVKSIAEATEPLKPYPDPAFPLLTMDNSTDYSDGRLRQQIRDISHITLPNQMLSSLDTLKIFRKS